MATDSFVGDAMSPSPYTAAMAEVERLRDQLAEKAMRNRELREELASVLADWNALVEASGSKTNGGLVAHVAALRRDAARYRWLRDPPGDWWNTYCVCAKDEALFGDKLDSAIDAARGAK